MDAKRLVVMGTAFLFILAFFGLASAQEEKVSRMSKATGVVKAVTMASKSIVVEAELGGKKNWTIGAEVTDKTKLQADGKTITLEDIKVGNTVTITWTRLEDKLIANSIVVKK